MIDTGIKNSTINIDGNNNSFNLSVNVTINIDQRGNLKNRHDGKEHEFVMFCIEEAEHVKGVEGTTMVLCTNIYSNYEFITDHAFITFPEQWYGLSRNFNIMKVKGKVYKYTRGDKTEDYSIVVTDILDMSNRILCYLKGTFGINLQPDGVNEFNRILDMISENELYDLVYEQLILLDTTIANNCYIRQGFISGLLMTRYFLNTQLQLLVNQQTVLRNSSRDALVDLFKLLSYIMYGIDKGELYLWENILKELNKLCNYIQGINYDFPNRTEQQRQIIFDNIKQFAIKINCNEYKKLHGRCKTYNRNVGYNYPENVDEFEDKLKFRALSYLLSKGRIKFN